MLVYASTKMLPPTVVPAFIAFYIASNAALYFLDEKHFRSLKFYTAIAIVDTLVLTSSLIINGQVEKDFYLAYFLLIIIACVIEDLKLLAAITVLAPVVYGDLLFRATALDDPAIYLRLPFLFVVSLFFGYFTRLLRTERELRKQADLEARTHAEFLGIVSHELRTPLNNIIGSTWLLETKRLGEMNAQQGKVVEIVRKNSEELLGLVNSVLEASRIENGPLKKNVDDIDLRGFLEELKVLYDKHPAEDLTLTWDYPSGGPVVKTDKIKLKTILQNLINNSIKFTEKGTVTVSSRYLPGKDGVEFKVADTGIGMPKTVLTTIFEKFHQVDGSPTREHGGIGLGLYIVKSFTELLGGTLAVDSEPGKGSTFTVTIPCGSRQTGAVGHW
jgi:signal transduction histidine kinase